MRKCRKYSKSGFYHSIMRGNDKQNIFYEDKDRYLFLALLLKYSRKYKIDIFGYALMDNHVHLLIYAPGKLISKFMQVLSSVYARKFNKKYDRIGHLFQDRFISEVIEDVNVFSAVFRYIIQNPEKAGIAKFDEYKWNSYKEYKKDNTFIKKKTVIDIFGNISNIYKFLHTANHDLFLEPQNRPSEKQLADIEKIKYLLESENPIIDKKLPLGEIQNKIRILKQHGFSTNTIARITRLPKYLIKIS